MESSNPGKLIVNSKTVSTLFLALVLTGCELIDKITGGAPLTPQDSQAIGASCRQTGRSLEECFERNPKADKANIYIGWKEMNEYMASNNLKTLPPIPDKPSEAQLAAIAKAEADKAKAQAQAEIEPDITNDPEIQSVLNSLEEIRRTRPVPGQKEAEKLLKLIKDSSAPDRVGDISEIPPISPNVSTESSSDAHGSDESSGH